VALLLDIKSEIEESSRDYVNSVSRLGKEERSKSLNKIQEMFKKATENSDNKVQIAMQMYEMVSLYEK
jgi:inhibitor of growth protein 5